MSNFGIRVGPISCEYMFAILLHDQHASTVSILVKEYIEKNIEFLGEKRGSIRGLLLA